MAKKRVGEPWMPAGEYGRSLPSFTMNLLALRAKTGTNEAA